MNVTLAEKADNIDSKQIKQQTDKDNRCENITKPQDTFNRLLTDISNKLGLSKAIYQK